MSKSEVKKVSRIKEKKKAWFKILAPPLFGRKEIGEAYLPSSEVAVGRTVNVNLKELTGNLRDQSAYVECLISSAEGINLHTVARGYSLTPASVKRMVRKDSDRVDDYFSFPYGSEQKLVVKSLVTTTHKTQHSVRTEMRKQIGAVLLEEAKKGNLGNFEAFLNEVVTFKLQAALKKKLVKIYPVKEVAFRSVELCREPLKEETAAEVPVAEAKAEEVVPTPEPILEEEEAAEETGEEGTEVPEAEA